jgi:CheY-like chemotaxis protein
VTPLERAAFALSRDLLMVVGRDAFIEMSPRAPELVGRSLGEGLSPSEQRMLEAALEAADGATLRVSRLAGREAPHEVRFVRIDGDERRLVGAVDVASTHGLTRALAHELNNATSIIAACARELDAGLGVDHALSADVHRVLAASRRLELVASHLVARPAPPGRSRSSLDEVLRSLQGELRRIAGEDVIVRVTRDRALPDVDVDRALLEDVVRSLVADARQAMPDGGSITLDTSCCSTAVKLAIRDTASARPHDSAAVATVREMLRPKGVTVECSALTHGREVVLSFVPARDLGTVLVVEPDRDERSQMRRALEEAGYRVLGVSSALEAVELAESHAAIDVLVTGVIVPGMDGAQLARCLEAARPQLATVFVTAIADADAAHMSVPLVTKPIDVQTLVRVVSKLIERR